MKGLAIYASILLLIVYAYILGELAEGNDPSTNVFALIMWLPVGVFFVKYIWKKP